MRVLVQHQINMEQWVGYEGTAGFSIGRGESCDLRLKSMFVSGEHARVERGPDGWELQLMPGANPVTVDGAALEPGRSVPLPPGCTAEFFEYILTFGEGEASAAQRDRSGELIEIQGLLHSNVLRRLDLRVRGATELTPTTDRLLQLDRIIDELLFGEFRERIFESPLEMDLLHEAFRSRLTRSPSAGQDGGILQTAFGVVAQHERELDSLTAALAERVRGCAGETDSDSFDQLIDLHFNACVGETVDATLDNLRKYVISRHLKKRLYDMIFGYGPLQDLLDDDDVSEIMVVDPRHVYVERAGRVVQSRYTFTSDDAAMSVIERIVAPLGRRIDRSQPLVDARLRDGSRVNAIIPPLAVNGPCITIRRFPKVAITFKELMGWRAITPQAVALLRGCVRYRSNIVIAGGTGSGKTTMLNALSALVPASERLVTIEDSAELRLQQEHVVTLETRPPNAEGAGGYSIRDLVKNALRMRPDRIIVGECRGAEAFDMLQAMNTGHDGSMTTLHSNSAEDVIARLEMMVLMGFEMPLVAVRRLIAQAVDLIVFVRRLSGGRRMVTQISEVMGVDPMTDQVEIRDIVAAAGDGDAAELRPSGFMPTFLEPMVDRGLLDVETWFHTGEEG